MKGKQNQDQAVAEETSGGKRKGRPGAQGEAKKTAKTKKKPAGEGGTKYKPIKLSPELAAVMGEEAMTRQAVVKKMWTIIKERNLYDPKNKQFAICDAELLKVFGVKRFRTFGMMKFLAKHFNP